MLKKVTILIVFLVLAMLTAVVVISAYGTRGVEPDRGVVNGILHTVQNPSAVIDGQLIKEGDIVCGAKVLKINRAMVEFERNGKRWSQSVGGKPSRNWK